jgi:GNAT superfamily N-acetyltransferase
VSVVIRPARREDCPSILSLVRELAVFERAPDAVTVSEAHFTESGFEPQPVWWALVVEAEDIVIGFALWYVRFSTWKGQRLYLEDLYVSEPWRGRGIGMALMQALIEEGKQRGFSGMMWQVLDWNEPALQFYRKLGATIDPEWVNASLDL